MLCNINNNIIDSLINTARNSELSTKLAAGILKNKHLVSHPKCNTGGHICKGFHCSSHHAELRAMNDYFGGGNLLYKKNRWCFKPCFEELDKG